MSDLSNRLEGLSRRERAALLELLRRKKEGAAPEAGSDVAVLDTAPPEPDGSGEAWEEGRTAPLSFAQERLWLIDQITPGTAAYNIPGAFRLLGRLDIPALARAVSEIVRRHTALRTVFLTEAGQPVQRIEPWTPEPSPLIDLSALPEELRDAEVRHRTADEAERPFDLTTGPLLRVSLLILASEHHVALYTMHHIVSDGWSMSLFGRELGDLYTAFSAGQPSPLPELPLQYADFALRQRDPAVQERLFRSLDWWKERLAGVEPLELPTDRPRPAVRSGRGTARSVLLPPQVVSHLSVLGRSERSTLYMVMLALFQILLHRITGQDDIAVGSPVANRTGVEQEQLIGFFVNTVVMRTGLGGDPPFLELLARVRATALEAYRHQEAPFERVVEAVQPERQLARTPLFQVLFALNSVQESMQLPGLTLEALGASSATAKFDLSLSANDMPQGLALHLAIDVDLYEPATADRMLRHLRNLVSGAVAAPETRLSDLPLLDPAEREQTLVEWNRTEVPFPRKASIHRLVEERVDRQPEALAVSADGSADLTYAELDAAANRLAHRLRALGAGPEVAVLVVVERSPALLVTVLAVLKSGSFFVPFDPNHPRERLAVIAARVGARLAVTQERSLGLLPEGVEAVCVDRDAAAIAAEPAIRPDAGVLSENLMYVIFTSGSTGEPKGVAVTHRNAARLLHGNAFAEIGPGETYVVLTAVTFDPSILEVWGTLVHGGRLAVLPPELPSLDELAHFLDRHRVTQMHLTTALFHQMAERRPERLAGLHRLAVGGEAISPALAGRALEAVPGLLMTNCYGPTEVTVISTTRDVTLEDARRPSMPIGTPVANTAVYVLDRWLQPLPVGVWGELYIGGEGVSRGYFGRPELTGERFVPDHLGGPPGSRLYRSGDMVRWRPDGVLDFAGRIDRQVKIRGFRVEPGEIEAAITTHPEVSEAAVLVRGEGSQRWLAAYVVGADGDELRRWLAGRLPDPMIPTDFVVLPELPLTPNGKVDRRALEKIAVDRKTDSFVPPQAPVEQALAALWVEVLGPERTGGRVGLHDHFFGLGGHSLLATRLVAAIRDTFEVELPLRVLFEWPTLEEIARAVEDARQSAGLPPWVDRRPAGAGGTAETSRGSWEEGGTAPASFAQERLWLLDQLAPGLSTYNMPGAIRLRGHLDIAALARAISEIVRRQASLRTVFATAGGQPVQRILPWRPASLSLVDLSALPEEARDAEVSHRAAAEARRPFDLEAGPLFRAALLVAGPEEHVLLYTLHHIVSDGWSMAVFYGEMAALYEAFSAGRPSPLPELPLQYPEIAERQRSRFGEERLTRALAWWQEKLAGLQTLELPTDRPRPPVRSGRGASRVAEYRPDLAAELTALSRGERATFYMGLLAVFQTFLIRSTGQDDIAVGSPLANRSEVDEEGLIGFFVNAVVMRTDASGDPRFRELLARVRGTVLDSLLRQEVPFEKVVEAVQPERQLGRTPLFQAMFSLQNIQQGVGMGSVELPGLTLDWVSASTQTAKFDLSVAFFERPIGLAARLEIDLDLYEVATADRMLRQLGALLDGVLATPDARLSDLPLLDPAERVQTLIEWNRTEVPFPREVPIHRLVEARVDRQPEALAVSADCADGSADLTYAELDAAANRLAHRLRALGAGPEVAVLVVVERSPALLVTVLAVLKSGSFFVPFDPNHPRERLAVIAARVGARLAVTQERALGLLPEGVEAVCVDRDAAAIAAEPAVRPDAGTVAENLMYVIFTSGSTGEPKGVAVTHRNAARLLYGNAFAEIGPGETYVVLTAVTFDPSILEVWGTLVHGGRLAVLPPEFPSLDELAHFLDRHQVTQMHLTTALFHQMAERRPERLAGLHRLAVGGEAISPALAGRALEAVPGLLMTNCYGPTEVTVISTTRDVTLEDARRPSMPIGTPVANTSVYVLDRWLQPLPVGVWGELYIGGEGVSRGYFGRPELTGERFVPDHLGGPPGSRLYRSGDMVRWRPDGVLDFAGRIDRQVKIRGFRVEPGEIEAAITTHPEVSEAAVLVRGEGSQRWLAAYVVGADGDELRRWLAGRLPDPMIPTDFVVLPELPLTPNGKVDRRALEKITVERKSDGFVPPRTPVEEALAGLWVEVLGAERTGGRIGVHDHFFGLGGHSLLATRLVAAIRDVFGVELPLRVVFERPALEEMAAAIAEMGQAGTADEPVLPIPREPGVNRFPVSFSQLREWILDRLEPGNPAYNIPSNLRVEGPLSIPVLTDALNRLVHRHEVFRTAFAAGDGEPLQVVHPEVRLEVPVIDLSALPEEARQAELGRRVRQESGTGFDLAAAPLLRARIVRLGPADHALLLTVHHIVSDGWSMGILNQELAAFYEGATLPPLPVQYADYSVWLRRRLDGEGLERQAGYWRERLAGAPPLLELPTDRPRPPVRSSRGGKVRLLLPQPLAGRLEELARRHNASLFMVLLAGYQAVLARWSGQDDVVVGTYSGNRSRRELEGLIGFFINTLVLRTDLAGEPSFADLIGRTRETTLGAFAHQDVPFEKLLEILQLPRDPSRTPLFQALLVLQNFPPARADLSTGVRLSGMAAGSEKSDYDLALWLGEGPDGIAGVFEYSTDLFEEATIERLATQLRTLLEAAVADPDRNLWALPLIGEEEQARQLAAWSRGPAVPEGEVLLHRLVEEQAVRTPDALALEAGSVRLTYAELVEQARREADLLREAGVGPGSIVALAAERSPELIVRMLAVLQAGAAYLPIDPAYPAERRAYMLQDSGALLYPHPPAPSPTRTHSLPGEGEPWPEASESQGEAVPPLPGGSECGWERGSGGEGHSPAYVIYTSGSTGRPKGVVVPHRAISSFVRGAREGYGLGPGDRVLQFASISFDTSAEEIWPALASGATLVLRPEDMASSIPHFLRELERLGITCLDLPTAFWHEVAAGLDAEGMAMPRGLRLVILGGEEALADRLALWQRRVGPAVRLVNTYGPTETTIVATRRDLTGLTGGVVPIGRPIAGARAYVLDRFFTPVPPGVRGELWVGGSGVAQGYLGRPDLTAERFVPDPFGGEPGARLYRTGDVAVLRPDGDLVFAGRADRQLKVRGYRIEPGEIEAALRLHPALRDAVVDARGPGDAKRIVAWIVPREGVEVPGASDLRAFLRNRLPEPLLPAAFAPVGALPLTPSGKVDRRALPEPAEARPDHVAYAEPQSALERTIAGIYGELLRVARVGLHDNFFDLGGHSLLIVRAHLRLQEALGREIPVVDLFRFPTVAALARHLGGEETGNLQKVQGLAEQQRAAQQRQRAAMERLRRPGGPGRR